MERVFITGVTGFIGSELARRYVRAGARVSGLVRPESRDRVPEGVEPIVGDLASVETLAGVVRGHDLVFNVAGLVMEPRPSDPGSEAYHEATNSTGASVLAREALASGARRFVQVSTIGVYGDRNRDRIDERTPAVPDSVYHRTKYAADRALLGLFESDRLPVVIVRPPITVGPGNLKTHLLKMARLAARGMFPTFGSALTQRLPLIELEDLCAALELASERGPDGEVYVVSSGQDYTFGRILEAMARFSGSSRATIYCPAWVAWSTAWALELTARVLPFAPPLTRHKLCAFTQDRSLNIAKARQELGFTPRHVDLDDLLRRALEDYRARGLLPPAKAST